MKIGIVVHGPNIIDSGCALKIINILEHYGDVKCRLGGTMGRTAVIDASLEDKIDISNKLLPSESIKLFKEEGVDVIFLLNYGKSSTTGHVFGFQVFKNSFNIYDQHSKKRDNKINQEKSENIPMIQIERPGEKKGSIILWNGKKNDLNINLVNKIANLLKLKHILPEDIIEKHFSEELIYYNKLNKNNLKLSESNVNDSKIVSRRIKGTSPNENIIVNGLVIGRSTSSDISIIAKNGVIFDLIGGSLKKHGVEKLGKIDLNKAIVKTGLLRKSKVTPRIIKKEKNLETLKIAFLDHAAENIYDLRETDLVVTIGDDTTLVASDILYRFNIPIIGITDGDLDKVVENGFKNDNSMIIELKEGFDDIVGNIIFNEIFKSKNIIEIRNKIESNKDFFKNKEIENFKNQILKVINKITSKYKIKE